MNEGRRGFESSRGLFSLAIRVQWALTAMDFLIQALYRAPEVHRTPPLEGC
jgi:hypothetical protein